MILVLISISIIVCPITWIILETKNKHVALRIIFGILTVISATMVLSLYCAVKSAFSQSNRASYISMIKSVNYSIAEHLKTSEHKDDAKVKNAIESLEKLSHISPWFNTKDIQEMEKIRDNLNKKKAN